jgi:methanogenic corrinoid protein MtbC1
VTDYRDITSLRRDSALLARKIVAYQYENNPIFATFGDKGYERALEDAAYNLDYLLTSFEQDSPLILHRYLEWADGLFRNMGLPEGTLSGAYEAIAAEFRQMRDTGTCDPELAEGLLAWIDAGLTRLNLGDRSPSPAQGQMTHEGVLKAYGEALLAGQRSDAIAVIRKALADGVPIKALYRDVFHPFQISLGERWHRREISVAQEHLATASTQYIMSMLYDELMATPKRDRVLIGACIGGELHEMGMRMICDYMEASGWHTHYLGANMPEKDLIEMAQEKKPHAIALSCTMAFHLPRLKSAIRALREALPEIPVVVGGYPFNIDGELYRKVGADGTAKGFDEVYGMLETLAEEGENA